MDVAEINFLLGPVRFFVSYVLTYHHNFYAFGLFILLFDISVIIHQQLVVMLRGHMRVVYRSVFDVVMDSNKQSSL